MVFPRMRAWIAGALFVAWLGFLATLAFKTHERVIVAGPQIVRSNLVVVARLKNAEGRPANDIKILKILYAEKADAKQLVGETLELDELVFLGAKQGWNGPGDYVVPLTRRTYEMLTIDQVTPLPISPGYYPLASDVTAVTGKHPERLAQRVADLTGAPVNRLRDLFQVPVVVISNANVRTLQEKQVFANAIREAGGEVKAFNPAESRIYPATPDLIQQVESVLLKR